MKKDPRGLCCLQGWNVNLPIMVTLNRETIVIDRRPTGFLIQVVQKKSARIGPHRHLSLFEGASAPQQPFAGLSFSNRTSSTIPPPWRAEG